MSIENDNQPRPKAVPGLPRALDLLGLDELDEYRAVLADEMARVDVEIERKRSVRGSAESLFKL